MRDFAHGGNLAYLSGIAGLPEEEILDFSANINPLGPPDWLRPVVSSALGSLVHYPDPDASKLTAAASRRYRVPKEQVLVGNGSTEIIHLLPRALNVSRVLVPVPTYSDYQSYADSAGLAVHTVALQESAGFELDFKRLRAGLSGGDLVFLCRPNNPTGLVFDANELRQTALDNPSSFFVVDEAFRDFVSDLDGLTDNRPCNVAVLLSLTKIFAIPGLRLGCAVAEPDVVTAVRRIQPYWSVNGIAQAVGEAALGDSEYVERSRQYVARQRERLTEDLESIGGLTVYPGRANFLLVRIDRTGVSARTTAEKMLRDGIAIRLCENFQGLDDRFFRMAVRTRNENMRFCESLRRALGVERRGTVKRSTPALMFQGTSSNAGKSVMTAALCRILLQDGYRVAPFKAQNMSLNSFVTRDGGEMGRAQVVQAQACRLDPDVRMNPVLLKPNSDTGSQVIVMGKPVANMDVFDYVKYKSTVVDTVGRAYDSLAAEHDAIVLEGAGSPAEVNLKHHDIVNMHMAKYAKARVLLVGDIDRGGVFASFVGTMEVLAEWERSLVAGFVVNRFRGNQDLLHDAHEYVRRHTGRPVLGVVPYFHDLGLPEEDSVSFKEGLFKNPTRSEECVEIAVVDLPHISNFTDFDAFLIEPDVRLKKVRRAEDLDNPDAIIIPGSKNVIGDLEHLRNHGLEAKIGELTQVRGTELVGICGGFQMIGSRIADPHGLESDGKTLPGLDFLPMTTVLELEKTLTLVSATHLESGLTVRGYEIHHGQTESMGLAPLLEHESGRSIGVKSPDGRLWGTYIHGIFDSDEFRRWFIDRLRSRRGLPEKGRIVARYNLEPAFDRLADAVRNSLDMGLIYKIMGL
ncbi:MAG: cobyric acid synthase [Desulfomonilaceae bacterium]|nr:cobyric acid synthase [Desulfomonilaceae bacterium]